MPCHRCLGFGLGDCRHTVPLAISRVSLSRLVRAESIYDVVPRHEKGTDRWTKNRKIASEPFLHAEVRQISCLWSQSYTRPFRTQIPDQKRKEKKLVLFYLLVLHRQPASRQRPESMVAERGSGERGCAWAPRIVYETNKKNNKKQNTQTKTK